MRSVRGPVLLLLLLLTAPLLAGCAEAGIRPQAATTDADISERAKLERDLSLYSD